MTKTPAQIIADLTAARETMEVLINRQAPSRMLAAQERLVNALRKALTAAQQATATVGALASELGMEASELLGNLPTGYGQATRLSDRERAALRTVYGK